MLRVRWLGRVGFRDAHVLQRALLTGSTDNYLLLLEHPHVFTLGVRARDEHVLVDPKAVGVEVVRTDRGGEVTYHGPGQLVGYPIVAVPFGPDATPTYVRTVEQLLIDVLGDLGLASAGRIRGFPGVWIEPDSPEPRKIGAIGVRVTRGRSMHGFALNVTTDMTWFDRIVPCGLQDKAVTSLAQEGIAVTMGEVVEAVVARATGLWGRGETERQDASTSRRYLPLISPLALDERKPPWLRVKADMGQAYRDLKRTMRSRDLVTVCEEAGCPNIFDCWNHGTATFMINGAQCTRACGFCLVDTSRPGPLDPEEASQVADAVAAMGLTHAVVTAVARDDLADGGAAAFARTIGAIRDQNPETAVEVLIPDCRGDQSALDAIFEARPDVLNHNLETVVRLQRRVRPSASYARSLAVLARAKSAGLTTKSGLMVGLGETAAEVVGALADLRAVGVDIVTIGQYLRPSAAHLPVARWWDPEEFESLAVIGRAMGFAHVQASPLTRSSYHARDAHAAAAGVEGTRR